MQENHNLNFSKASICIHGLSTIRCDDLENTADTKSTISAYKSFETDMLSLSFQGDRPFHTHLLTSDPIEITLLLTPTIKFSLEGNTKELSRPYEKLPVRAHLSYTDFNVSCIRIWHIVFTPTPGRIFNECDLIQIAKLYTGHFEETEPKPEESIQFIHKNTTLYSVSELVLHLVPSHLQSDQGFQIIGGTIQASCASLAETPKDWKAIINSIKSCDYGNHEACLELENQLKSDSVLKSQLMSWCGIVVGIFDYYNMIFGELLDTLRPTVPGIGELINVHRSNLVCLSPEDDLLERCWDNIGISPYLLIPHAAILHNEVLINRANRRLYEILNDNATIKSMEELQEHRKTIEKWISVDSLPNVFHYECEKSLFDEGLKTRGYHEQSRATRKMQSELSSRIEDSKRKSDKKYGFWLSIIMAFLSGLATHSVLHELAADIDSNAPILEWYFFIPILAFIVGASTVIAHFIRKFT